MTLLQSTVRACKKQMINTDKKYDFLNMYYAIHPYSLISLSSSCISLIWNFTQYLHNIILFKPHIFQPHTFIVQIYVYLNLNISISFMSISLVFSPNTLTFWHIFGPSGQLKSLGMRPTTEDDQPDLVLLNTCSIREKARNGLDSRLLTGHISQKVTQ